METTKSTRGRKPAEDKKVCIRLYILSSVVTNNGGEEELKEYLYHRAKSRAKNVAKKC